MKSFFYNNRGGIVAALMIATMLLIGSVGFAAFLNSFEPATEPPLKEVLSNPSFVNWGSYSHEGEGGHYQGVKQGDTFLTRVDGSTCAIFNPKKGEKLKVFWTCYSEDDGWGEWQEYSFDFEYLSLPLGVEEKADSEGSLAGKIILMTKFDSELEQEELLIYMNSNFVEVYHQD